MSDGEREGFRGDEPLKGAPLKGPLTPVWPPPEEPEEVMTREEALLKMTELMKSEEVPANQKAVLVGVMSKLSGWEEEQTETVEERGARWEGEHEAGLMGIKEAERLFRREMETAGTRAEVEGLMNGGGA